MKYQQKTNKSNDMQKIMAWAVSLSILLLVCWLNVPYHRNIDVSANDPTFSIEHKKTPMPTSNKIITHQDRLDPIWVKTWGGIFTDSAGPIVIDSTSLYVLESTNSSGNGYKGVLHKFNLDGSPVWNKTWDDIYDEYLSSMALYNSAIYVAGVTNSSGAGEYDIVLLKYDRNGTLLWNKTWGGKKYDVVSDIAVTNTGIYMTGDTDSFGASSGDVLILKYDLDGNLVWNRTWGGLKFDSGHSIVASENGIYITGLTGSFGAGGRDVLVLKYDLNGNLVWNKTWGGSWSESGFAIAINGSEIWVVGNTNSFDAWGRDVVLLKYNMDGELLQNKTWGRGADDFPSSIAIGNNAFYIAGTVGVPINPEIVLLKYDLAWNLQWAKTFNIKDESGAGSIAIDGNAIYMTGSTRNLIPRWYDYDAFVLKTDLEGGKPNRLPSCNILLPSSNQIVSGTVEIKGNATDPDGDSQIAKVEVRIDSENWNVANGTVSWNYSWDTTKVFNGQHTIYARAYDGKNYSSTASVTVTVSNVAPNHPPICVIISPSPEQTVSGRFTITGKATDPDGNAQLVRVEVWIGAGPCNIANGTTSWNYSWDTRTVSNGRHTIYARAYDGTNYSDECSVTVTVNNSVPAKYYKLSGHVYKSGTSQAISNAIVSVQPDGYSDRTDSNGYYSLLLRNGTYTITITASGYQQTSASVTISGANITKDFYLTESSLPTNGGVGFETGLMIGAIIISVAVWRWFVRKRE